MRTKTLLRCPWCKGTAVVELSERYADTLDLLRKHGESTGAELARVVGCKATAMNNRLAMLEHHGLATSRWSGRHRFYKANR